MVIFSFYIKTFNIISPISPVIPTIVSITVHVERVSLTVKLKYSLNNQKPASFTWESIKLPEPIANTINSGLTSELEINGKTIPAAVKPATVAEPTQTLITVAINHANINGDTKDPSSKDPI